MHGKTCRLAQVGVLGTSMEPLEPQKVKGKSEQGKGVEDGQAVLHLLSEGSFFPKCIWYSGEGTPGLGKTAAHYPETTSRSPVLIRPCDPTEARPLEQGGSGQS